MSFFLVLPLITLCCACSVASVTQTRLQLHATNWSLALSHASSSGIHQIIEDTDVLNPSLDECSPPAMSPSWSRASPLPSAWRLRCPLLPRLTVNKFCHLCLLLHRYLTAQLSRHPIHMVLDRPRSLLRLPHVALLQARATSSSPQCSRPRPAQALLLVRQELQLPRLGL
jgi:hypothetical protein